MNLIALKNFRNVKSLRLRGKDQKSTVPDSIHDDHIQKGARFSMGDARTLDELKEVDAPTAYQVASLIAAGCVGPADDKDVVADVEAELKADAKKADKDRVLDSQASLAEIGRQFIAQSPAKSAK